MSLIRLAFWLGLAVLLLPTDERQQARLYGNAMATVQRIATFCERNAEACAAGADLWATFVKKAEFGAHILADLASSEARKAEIVAPASVGPASVGRQPERAVGQPADGTLTANDLVPPWRGGQVRRTAQRAGT
jgi:hypothetical protein